MIHIIDSYNSDYHDILVILCVTIEKEDNYGLVVGLSIGIPLGVLALVAINLFFCQYLRRSNKKRLL